jgi:hypothetical protein
MCQRLPAALWSLSFAAVLFGETTAAKGDPVRELLPSALSVHRSSTGVLSLLCLPGEKRLTLAWPEAAPGEADPKEQALQQRVGQLARLRKAAHLWLARDLPAENLAPTQAYADLTFAFALARLGESEACRPLLRSATDVLARQDEVHRCLLRAFTYRVEQALEKRPHAGPLPTEVFEPLPRDRTIGRIPRYKVDRLRDQSRILEPQERVDPFLPWAARGNEVFAGLAALEDVRDKAELEKGIRRLLQVGAKKPEEGLIALSQALSLSTRVGEAFTAELLGRVVPALDAVKDARAAEEWQAQVILLERAVLLAADQGNRDLVKDLAGRSFARLKMALAEDRLEQTRGLAGQTLRALRRLGLRQETARLLATLVGDLPDRQALARMRGRYGNRWPAALLALVELASVRLYLGQGEDGAPTLVAARVLLLPPGDNTPAQPLAHVARARLASTYATALGQGPAEAAVTGLEDLLKKMDRLTDTFTTATHYSKLHLLVIEAMALGIDPPGP